MLSKAGKQSFDRLRVIFPGNIKNHALKSFATYACKMHDLTNEKKYLVMRCPSLTIWKSIRYTKMHANIGEFEFPEWSKRMILLLVDNTGLFFEWPGQNRICGFVFDANRIWIRLAQAIQNLSASLGHEARA